MMSRELQGQALPRKKSLRDSAQDMLRLKRVRAAFAGRITKELDQVLHRRKLLDESGVNLGLTRLYGRATPGERVVEATPGTSGAHYTLVAALDLKGVQAPLLFEGAMTRLMFEGYIKDILAPKLRRGEMVLMDNLSAHKSGYVRALLEACGVQMIFLPPYSPDLNPIEKCGAKVKQALRAAKARTWDDLLVAVRTALLSVSPSDALAWFAHCGI